MDSGSLERHSSLATTSKIRVTGSPDTRSEHVTCHGTSIFILAGGSQQTCEHDKVSAASSYTKGLLCLHLHSSEDDGDCDRDCRSQKQWIFLLLCDKQKSG